MNRDESGKRADRGHDRGSARDGRGDRGRRAVDARRNRAVEKFVYIAGWRFERECAVAGVRPVLVAAERGILKRLVVPKDERRRELLQIVESLPPNCIRYSERRDFDAADTCDGHQHCIGEIEPLSNPSLAEVVPATGASLVILLDGVTDPRNAGAIARSAAAVGAHAILLPAHNAAPLGATFYKASAGMVLTLPICRGGNLSQALDELARFGYWSVAASVKGAGASDALTFQFPERCALVLGSEGEGIREKLEKKCDYRAFIPMSENVESLNVSVAAGILAYLWRISVSSA
jgi:23S rRNA (guanosine2251-2'-O)-methyltransferase